MITKTRYTPLGCLPESVEKTIAETESCDSVHGSRLPVPIGVDQEWIATVCSNHPQRETTSSKSPLELYSIHPTAYLIKALAVILRLNILIDKYNRTTNALGAEIYRLTRQKPKCFHDPNHHGSKMWKRRSQSKLAESKTLVSSIKALNKIIILDLNRNFKLFNARICGERLEAAFSSSYSYDPSSDAGVDDVRRKVKDTRSVMHKENIEWTKGLRNELETSNDATKQIVLENYDICSSCQVMCNKHFSPLLGTVRSSCQDSPESDVDSFVCFECCDSKQKTRIEGLSEDRSLQNPTISKKKKKSRKKKKKKTTQSQTLALDINHCETIQKDPPSPPKSPTSVFSFPLLKPEMESLCLPKALSGSAVKTANFHNGSWSDALHPVNDEKPAEVSNDDLVDYLMQCGSILELNQYMDELGLDCH